MNESIKSFTIDLRVRYVDCDQMGYVHHSVYPVWFEIARTELLRANGWPYSEIEKSGVGIVIARLSVQYKSPARYDDQIKITASLSRLTAAKIEHEYHIHRGDELLCTGSTVLACINSNGKVIPVPDKLKN